MNINLSALTTVSTEERNSQKDAVQKLHIQEAAKFVFQQYGFVKASMDDIAKHAAKSRTTIYKYYKNKDLVFEDFICSIINEIVHKATAAIGDATNLEARLINYTSKKLELLSSTFSTYKLVASEITEETSHFIFIKKYFSLVEKDVLNVIFQESIQQKEIGYIKEPDLEFLISVVMLALRGIEAEAFSAAKKDPLLEQRLIWLIGLLVKGLQ